MADPTRYLPGYSYSDFESSNPSSPKPGSQLDNDFALIQEATDSLVDAVKDIRRSDGALKNGIVTADSLADSLSIGFTLQGAWAAGTDYAAGDGVTYSTSFYKARVAHTSANASRPDLDSTTWAFLFSFSAVAVTDGSITAVKLNAGDAAAIRGVVGQEELVAEGIANVAAETAPADADLLPLADTSAGGVLKKLTFANLKEWIRTGLGALFAASSAKTTPVDTDLLPLVDSASSNATSYLTFANLKAAIWTALGGLIAGGTGKTTPADADTFPLADSAAASATKKVTWANIKAAIFSSLGALIGTGTGKTTPVDADALVLMDSAASNATKILTWANLKATLKSYFDTLYGPGGMTLLGTLTTTSGTTQSLTGIDVTPYRYLRCELDGVSFTATAALTVALSSTNGAAYGTAGSVTGSIALSDGAYGVVVVENVNSTVAAAKTAWAQVMTSSGSNRNGNCLAPTNTAAIVNAIQFGGGTFDAGAIRIYGVK